MYYGVNIFSHNGIGKPSRCICTCVLSMTFLNKFRWSMSILDSMVSFHTKELNKFHCMVSIIDNVVSFRTKVMTTNY